MNCGTLLAISSAQALLWISLAIIGVVGLVAVLSPARFNALATRGAFWVDTSKLTVAIDKRFDIDRFILPFSRILGVAVLAAVGVLAYVMVRFV